MSSENDQPPAAKPILIYDGRCSFCGIWIAYWKQLTAGRVKYAPSQEVAAQYPGISSEDFKRSVWLVLPGGQQFSGAEAVFRMMDFAEGKHWPLWLYRHVPGFAPISEAGYRLVAGHRDVFYWVTRFFWGKRVDPESFRLSRSLFLRGLALVYFIAFLSLTPQILGLIGENGIQPVRSYLNAVHDQFGSQGHWVVPTLAWLNSNDMFLQILCWGGVGFAVILFAGFMPMISLAGLWIFYLSIVNVGPDFLSFQWDSLLLETGFAALLLAPGGIRARYASEPPIAARWVLRILLFRLMLESGLVKLLSGDVNWRTLSALNYHYETQPLPTRVAWYAQHLPPTFQKASVLGVFLIELVVPFLFLMPRRFRIVGAWTTILFQLAIALTGNYTFFNLLTIVLCIPLLDDRHLHYKPRKGNGSAVEPQRTGVVAGVVAAALIGAGLLQLSTLAAHSESLPAPEAWIEEHAELWHVVNPYGLFSVMTTSREEIVVEGSDDDEHWTEFEFKFKPGDLQQAPRWVAPYQPRLDWQMWFAALSNYKETPWFSQFMLRLLQGSPDVLDLLKDGPFPDHPPKFVRAQVYEYHFSDPQTRRTTGAWWTRKYLGVYFPVVSLRP